MLCQRRCSTAMWHTVLAQPSPLHARSFAASQEYTRYFLHQLFSVGRWFVPAVASSTRGICVPPLPQFLNCVWVSTEGLLSILERSSGQSCICLHTLGQEGENPDALYGRNILPPFCSAHDRLLSVMTRAILAYDSFWSTFKSPNPNKIHQYLLCPKLNAQFATKACVKQKT